MINTTRLALETNYMIINEEPQYLHWSNVLCSYNLYHMYGMQVI